MMTVKVKFSYAEKPNFNPFFLVKVYMARKFFFSFFVCYICVMCEICEQKVLFQAENGNNSFEHEQTGRFFQRNFQVSILLLL